MLPLAVIGIAASVIGAFYYIKVVKIIYFDDPAGEIACVAIHPNYRKSDRGSELMTFLEKRAISKGLRKLFVLTTRTGLWFQEHGFVPASVDELPKSRQSLYNFQRNSLVFSKPL